MKKISTFITVFLFCSLSFFAQTNNKKWKNFSPPLEEFSVEIPSTFTAKSFSNDNESRRYSGMIDGTYYFIFSEQRKEDAQYKTVLKFIENYQKNELEKQKQSATMKFSFSDDEDFYHTIFTAKTKNRLYAFHLVSSLKNNPSVKRFFKSLKLKKQTVAGEPDILKTETENSDTNTDLPEIQRIDPWEENTGQGTGSGRGAGMGSGNGQGSGLGSGRGSGSGGGGTGTSGNGNIKTSTVEIIQNKPLNITYKAKPQYTDFARFYNIIGNVLVRTTFSKDGAIGSAVPVSKLPFGLTNSAITAAKKMRFEPQILKGQKVSVVKTIVFTFTIY